MKIGILTFHCIHNYGAVLQAYALQKYLQKEFPKVNIQIINFKTRNHIYDNRIFKKLNPSKVKNMILQLFTLFRYFELMCRKNKFQKFTEQELILTKQFSSEKEFLLTPPMMDIYITGSDQVFNPNIKHSNIYYLSFDTNNATKIAYAPSFGNSNIDNQICDKIKLYLQDFDVLSCRELIGAELISKLLNKPVSTVCDPVFLLNKRDWMNIAEVPSIKSKYIFVYDLNGGKSLIAIANKVKLATGYNIICMTQHAHVYYDVDVKMFNVGPKEFIGFIANAEYIITDSFHGTAFSIIFNKKFFTYIAIPNSSERIRSLLKILNMRDRIVEYEKFNDFCFDSCSLIDYKKRLEYLIAESKDFLKKSIC